MPSAGRRKKPSRRRAPSVAALIDADPREIVWTSGATESDNLALKGVAEKLARQGQLICVTVVTEHKAVLDTAKHLEQTGHRVTYLGVDTPGQIDLDELQRRADRRDGFGFSDDGQQ